MDFSDGEVRYRACEDVEEGVLSQKMVANMVSISVATVDRYYPAIMKVCYGDITPEAAFNECNK